MNDCLPLSVEHEDQTWECACLMPWSMKAEGDNVWNVDAGSMAATTVCTNHHQMSGLRCLLAGCRLSAVCQQSDRDQCSMQTVPPPWLLCMHLLAAREGGGWREEGSGLTVDVESCRRGGAGMADGVSRLRVAVRGRLRVLV